MKRPFLLAGLMLAITARAGTPESVTLDVKGMDCAACPVTVKTVLKKQPGVTEVKVDLNGATAQVIFDPGKVSREKLAQVVTESGFPSTARK